MKKTIFQLKIHIYLYIIEKNNQKPIILIMTKVFLFLYTFSFTGSHVEGITINEPLPAKVLMNPAAISAIITKM
jgi:hypothetical protein